MGEVGLLLQIRSAVSRGSCALWGHVVDNRVFGAAGTPSPACRCGAPYLHTDGRTTHVRHTLSCFLRHHTYRLLAERHGVREYVCIRCGHPLLFPQGTDRFAGRGVFTKRVRYACGLFGHRVRPVTRRHGFVEYACPCGHSFLEPDGDAAIIHHPLICVLRAHRVRFLTTREGYSEYVCVDCGHPFCFMTAGRPDAALARARARR
jgi:DNA-directed RNA polymerase subunit RPC12/RpoP